MKVCRYAALLGLVLILGYGLIGHSLIRTIYDHNLLAGYVMKNRAEVSVQSYLSALDDVVLGVGADLIVAAGVSILLLRNTVGILLAGLSASLCWFALFSILDVFPALVRPLHFDMLPYFNYRLTYEFDPVLGFRERPWHAADMANFRGSGYSPVYGIDVPATRVSWRTDGDGFRNPPNTSAADVVVIGSSFGEYGMTLEDTFPQRLETALGSDRVAGLSKAGYGPFQYLEVLERYALKKSPQYALFTFYPASDTDGHLSQWLNGREDDSIAKRNVAFGKFLPRYRVASDQALNMFTDSAWTGIRMLFETFLRDRTVHPEVAALHLPNGTERNVVFADQHRAATPSQLLKSPEWQVWENILIALKGVCERNEIVPVMVYIPSATEVYAEYSTTESGAKWLEVRDKEIASSGSAEEAAHILAARVGMPLISLRPAFQRAAKEGKFIYYPMDAHWNEEGRQIGAEITAKGLRKIMATSGPVTRRGRTRMDDGIMVRTLDGTIQFWDGRAEQLYGWTKKEAIGQVSHTLLRTKFPLSLQEIDSKLVQTGSWEGELVHATRDGGRIVVNSHWILDPDSGAVIEMNQSTSTGRF